QTRATGAAPCSSSPPPATPTSGRYGDTAATSSRWRCAAGPRRSATASPTCSHASPPHSTKMRARPRDALLARGHQQPGRAEALIVTSTPGAAASTEPPAPRRWPLDRVLPDRLQEAGAVGHLSDGPHHDAPP